MILRPASIQDTELLLSWRNDPCTRAMSHNTGKVTLDEHRGWLTKTLDNPARKLYIAESEGVPVGTVRADTVDGVTELSWTVSPQHRGAGVGKKMVRLIAESIRGPIRAEIKAGNIASMKIAEAAGMALDGENGAVLRFHRESR